MIIYQQCYSCRYLVKLIIETLLMIRNIFSINNIQEDSIMSSKGYGKSANYQTNLEINYASFFQSDKSNLKYYTWLH